MDRFIVQRGGEFSEQKAILKSNMDRFIGCIKGLLVEQIRFFKIQYG